MKIIQCEQRSPEWYEARLGIPTASDFDKIFMANGATSKQAEKYMYKLAGEKVSGKAEDTYQNSAMIRGIEMEAEARDMYGLIYDVQVEQVGFCLSDCGRFGCSPDGLVSEDGGLEIKCPIASTHVMYLINKQYLLSDYLQQVNGSLLVTGRKWWDLMSYYPGLKPVIIRVERDEAYLSKIGGVVDAFCVELENVIRKIQ